MHLDRVLPVAFASATALLNVRVGGFECNVERMRKVMFTTNFTWVDWLIVTVYLLGTGAVGMWVNRYIHNVEDYMVGGRASGAFLNTASFIGTGLGLVTIMYASIDGFNHGFACLILPAIGVCGALFVGSTGFVIKRLRTLKLTTITEFFEVRFDRRCRIAAGLICAVAGILNMGLFCRGPSEPRATQAVLV